MSYYVLYESASGYGLFEVNGYDALANSPADLQSSIIDISRFGKSVKLAAFKPFTSAANALEQINAVSESQVRGFEKRIRCLHAPSRRVLGRIRPDTLTCASLDSIYTPSNRRRKTWSRS